VDQRKINHLADNWDWALAEVPTVTERPDGTLVVEEGQHRSLGLLDRNPDALIWVIKVASTDIGDEAATALGIAKGRRPHSKVQEWRMRVTAGLPHEVAATKVLTDLGLNVTEARGIRTVSAAGTMMKIIHGTASSPLTPDAGAEMLRKTLSVILRSIPDDQATGRRFDATLLTAVGSLLTDHPDLDLNRLANKLAERTATQWLAFRASTTPAWKGVQDMIVADYNKQLRSGRL